MKQTFFIMVMIVIVIVCLTHLFMTKNISRKKFHAAVNNPRNRELQFWSQDSMVKINSSHPIELLSNELNQLPLVSENIHLSSLLKAMPLSKDLVVYGAYFDDRRRNQHQNITMIFIAANKTVYQNGWITGCGVRNVKASSFKVRYVQEDILMHNWLGFNKFPFEQLAVECYDLDVINGSRAFVTFKIEKYSLVVESEKPLWIPAPRIEPSGRHNFTVLVCTKAHNKGVTYLPEFLRYQKTLGVDHVHLTIQDTYIKDGGFSEQLMNDPFFTKAVQDNFVSVRVWREWYEDKENYVHSTILQYLECIYQYRGTYDYVSLMDSDDFFVPRVPEKVYKDYIQDYCYEKSAGSCSFKWLWYYPDVCGMKGKVSDDGNVTAQLVPHRGVNEQNHLKSIHSMAAIVDSSFHDATCAQCLLPGYKVVYVPPHIAYVAHNRKKTGRDRKKVCHN